MYLLHSTTNQINRPFFNCDLNSLVVGVVARRREAGSFSGQQSSSPATVTLTEATSAPVTVAGGCSCDPSGPVVLDRFTAVAAHESLSASPATVTAHGAASPLAAFVGCCSSDPSGTVVLDQFQAVATTIVSASPATVSDDASSAETTLVVGPLQFVIFDVFSTLLIYQLLSSLKQSHNPSHLL